VEALQQLLFVFCGGFATIAVCFLWRLCNSCCLFFVEALQQLLFVFCGGFATIAVCFFIALLLTIQGYHGTMISRDVSIDI